MKVEADDDAFDDICEVSDGIHVIWLALTALEGVDHAEITRCVGELDDRLRGAIQKMIQMDMGGPTT